MADWALYFGLTAMYSGSDFWTELGAAILLVTKFARPSDFLRADVALLAEDDLPLDGTGVALYLCS